MIHAIEGLIIAGIIFIPDTTTIYALTWIFVSLAFHQSFVSWIYINLMLKRLLIPRYYLEASKTTPNVDPQEGKKTATNDDLNNLDLDHEVEFSSKSIWSEA
jgi:hypothetical protein